MYSSNISILTVLLFCSSFSACAREEEEDPDVPDGSSVDVRTDTWGSGDARGSADATVAPRCDTRVMDDCGCNLFEGDPDLCCRGGIPYACVAAHSRGSERPPTQYEYEYESVAGTIDDCSSLPACPISRNEE